jgi:two-component system response regulator RegA
VFYGADFHRDDPASGANTSSAQRFRKILVVDDDAAIRDALQRALSRSHAVHLAANSAGAMECAEKHAPDLAIVDLHLGSESGIELVRRLRVELPETRIVIMTGFGSIDSTVAAMHAGADDVIAKPFTVPELLRRAAGMAPLGAVEVPSLNRALWEHCSRVLAACGGNKSLAAKKLRMHRSRLRRILAKGPPVGETG